MCPATPLIDALTSLRKVFLFFFLSVITITSHFKQLKQRTKDTPNTISLTLYFQCLTHFFQVPHYILHVCVWSATLCFSCWHVPLCCRSVQWLGTHPDAGCSFLWALPHVLHQTQDIQWTQYVFCLISAHSLLFAFIIGRIHIIQWTRYVFCLFSAHSLLFAFIIGRIHTIQWTQYVFCLFFAFCLRYWEVTMNPSVFCFLLTFCFLPSLLGGIVCMQQMNTCCCTVIHTDCVLTIVSRNPFWP